MEGIIKQMRFIRPNDGESRERRIFLYLPITAPVFCRKTNRILKRKETRWWEYATIWETYDRYFRRWGNPFFIEEEYIQPERD